MGLGCKESVYKVNNTYLGKLRFVLDKNHRQIITRKMNNLPKRETQMQFFNMPFTISIDSCIRYLSFPNIRMLFSMSIGFSKFWNRDQQESSLIFYIKNHNSTKFFSIYILVSKATLKTAWLPYQYWKSHLDLLQFHKALVAAFPPVLKISYKLASFT